MENHSGAAKRYIRPVCEYYAAHRLAVHKRAVTGAEIDQLKGISALANFSVEGGNRRMVDAHRIGGIASQLDDGVIQVNFAQLERAVACAPPITAPRIPPDAPGGQADRARR